MNEWMEKVGISPELLDTLISYGIRIIGVLVILFVAFALARKVRSSLRKRLEQRIDLTLAMFGAGVAYWLIVLVAFISCLGIFGVETTSFAAVIGGATLAIGLAFQGSLSNVAAGVMLLVFRPYGVGDVIETQGVVGKVEELGLFSTTLDTPDNRRIIVPNGSVFGSVIENKTFHEVRRCDVAIGIGYGEDISKARELFEKTAAGIEGVLTDPKPQAYLTALGGSSVDFSVRVYCKGADYWGVKERVMQACKEACDAEGIDIPYPHQVIING